MAIDGEDQLPQPLASASLKQKILNRAKTASEIAKDSLCKLRRKDMEHSSQSTKRQGHCTAEEPFAIYDEPANALLRSSVLAQVSVSRGLSTAQRIGCPTTADFSTVEDTSRHGMAEQSEHRRRRSPALGGLALDSTMRCRQSSDPSGHMQANATPVSPSKRTMQEMTRTEYDLRQDIRRKDADITLLAEHMERYLFRMGSLDEEVFKLRKERRVLRHDSKLLREEARELYERSPLAKQAERTSLTELYDRLHLSDQAEKTTLGELFERLYSAELANSVTLNKQRAQLQGEHAQDQAQTVAGDQGDDQATRDFSWACDHDLESATQALDILCDNLDTFKRNLDEQDDFFENKYQLIYELNDRLYEKMLLSSGFVLSFSRLKSSAVRVMLSRIRPALRVVVGSSPPSVKVLTDADTLAGCRLSYCM